MKKNVILIIAMVFFFQLSQKAKADFYLEPFVGMLVNSTYDTGPDDGEISGSQVGARVGWTKLGFSLGLDGRRTSSSLESEDSNVDDSDYTATQAGFFVGYEFPILFRVWANYVFSSNASNDDNSEVKYTEGSGYTVGLGYKVFPFISLNLELFSIGYDKFKTALGEFDSDYKSEGMILGISVPVSI